MRNFRAIWFKRDRLFVLIPPDKALTSVAELSFTHFKMMEDFCKLCVWIMKRGF